MPRRALRHGRLLLLGVALVSGGCARTEQPKRLLRVDGHDFHKNGITRIWVHHANGVAWTGGTVKVFGLVSGITLRVAGCV